MSNLVPETSCTEFLHLIMIFYDQKTYFKTIKLSIDLKELEIIKITGMTSVDSCTEEFKV